MHTGEQFDARGLVVVTASDSTQYAFDGDEPARSVTPSRFTAGLVDGLASGEADVDRDGFVTVDAPTTSSAAASPTRVRRRAPRKWEFDVSGHIVLARAESAPATLRPAPALVRAAALPPRPPRASRRPRGG